MTPIISQYKLWQLTGYASQSVSILCQ